MHAHHLSLTLMATAAAVLAAMCFMAGPASAGSEVYSNASTITIPDSGAATPYPSSIDVQGQTGRITNVRVTLRGFSHEYPRDVDILLVAPDGQSSIVMSDACGNDPIVNYSWIFDQAAQAPMQYTTQFGGCDQLFYQPTNHGTGDVWPNAPAGPHTANFDNFVGARPNGTWRLYVYDGLGGDSGKIQLGWALAIDTADPVASVPFSPTDGRADVYPITRNVAGVSGVIKDLDVTLGGVYHSHPDDLDLLLVGPRGQSVMLMSDSCGSPLAKGPTWRWDDEATFAMFDTFPCPRGSYTPTDQEPGDLLPTPAPPGGNGTSLAAFDSTDPNGDWRLYVYDDEPSADDGFLTEPFALHFETRPEATVGFTEPAVTLTEGESRELTITRDANGDGLGAGSVKVTSAPLSATDGTDFEPVSQTVEFARGEAEKKVSVKTLADAVDEEDEAFTLTISQPSGDAKPGDAATARVTIHDVDPGTGGGGGGAGGGGGGGLDPVIDSDPPVVARVSLAPTPFSVARRATAVSAARGTVIRYTLSEPAAVALRFYRARTGRRVGTLRRAGRTGRNRVAFSGRIGRRALRPGRYRLRLTAVDAAGNRSVTRTRRFRIVRG